MKARLFRVGITSALLYGTLALAVFAVSEKAYPQDVAAKSDRLEAPERAAIPPIPDAPCTLPLDQFTVTGGSRILTGQQAEQYITAAGAMVRPGTDTVAYQPVGDKVAVFFFVRGCVRGYNVVDRDVHLKVMAKAFGVVV